MNNTPGGEQQLRIRGYAFSVFSHAAYLCAVKPHIVTLHSFLYILPPFSA